MGTALIWEHLPPADQNCSGSNSVEINDAGDVAFQSENGVVDPLIGVNEIRAVSVARSPSDLGTFGGNASGSLSINNRGAGRRFRLERYTATLIRYTVSFLKAPATRPKPVPFYGRTAACVTWARWAVRMLERSSSMMPGKSPASPIPIPSPNDTTGIPTLDPFLLGTGTNDRSRQLGRYLRPRLRHEQSRPGGRCLQSSPGTRFLTASSGMGAGCEMWVPLGGSTHPKPTRERCR